MKPLAVINESTTVTDAEVQAMIPAFQTQWNRDLAPVWGLDPCTIAFVPKGQKPAAGAWWIVFLDDSDQADALAYHDLTGEGLPLSKIFARTIAADKASLSVGATHEICEMAVDPWLSMAFQDADGMFWAGEVCDPVEDDRYGYDIGGVLVSDFVLPAWFAPEHVKGPIDFKAHAKRAFQVLSGGYAQKFDGKGWQQITGDLAAQSRRATPPAGSRRDRRLRGRTSWKNSAPAFGA